MSIGETATLLDDAAVQIVRRRIRILMLLEAAERAGITPLESGKFHAFAYLADVLSPVWDLPSFDGKILKLEDGPHYPDLQRELDTLIGLDLVEITDLRYIDRADEGTRILGSYALNLKASELTQIFSRLGIGQFGKALDKADQETHNFLVELASALATLPDDQIDSAAQFDPTYADSRIPVSNIVDFAAWATDEVRANPSFQTASRFASFLPLDGHLTAGEKLYLFASYLGRKVAARGA